MYKIPVGKKAQNIRKHILYFTVLRLKYPDPTKKGLSLYLNDTDLNMTI